jgi:HEAT repeat protein
MNASPAFLFEILGGVLAVEGILVLLGLLVIVGHAFWLHRERERSKRLLATAHARLAALLEEGAPRTGCEQFEHLPTRLQFRLLAEILPSLSGVQRQRLTRLATDLGLLTLSLKQCRSRWWWRRLRGARFCTSLGYGHPLILTLLTDVHPIVRSQAAEWASQYPTPLLIKQLLELLHDEEILCHYAAQDALLRMGDTVIMPLVGYLSTHSQQAYLEPALTVAMGLAAPEFLPAALSLSGHHSLTVRVRAVALLGALGGNDVVNALIERLDDHEQEVRREAARALGALGHWPAASRLAAALRDPAWIVRRESALSLRALGAPGLLFLRRALCDKDEFAADMARQALDVPETTIILPSAS